jgi:zinc/manganese transport system substrate-binding protein
MERTIVSSILAALAAAFALSTLPGTAAAEAHKLRIVATQSTWGSIAQAIGGDRVTVESLVRGDQDPHFVRPRPSLAQKLGRAELLVSTGLDLELWLPALVDLSGNKEIRSGGRRYVAVSQGIRMLDVPATKSRAQGDLHVYGNPHVQLSPLNACVAAKNVATGLTTVDPDGRDLYAKNYQAFCAEIHRRLYGEELVRLIGAPTLDRLAVQPGRLAPFLAERQYKGRPLAERLGGWLKQAEAFRGRKAVAYHKSWPYFTDVFGLDIRNYVEPRPGIPPSPRHIEELMKQMRDEQVRVIITENFYDESRVRQIASRVGGEAVVLPVGVGGTPEARDYFALMDHIVSRIAAAYR